MLIKPFESLTDVDKNQEVIRSVRTDISYYPNVVEQSRFVVSKKYLLKNFSSTKSLTLIKVVYVFYVGKVNTIMPEGNCDNCDLNKVELKDIEDLKLQYITTSLYDSDETHYFGSLIYDFTGQTPVVSSVFEFKQNVNVFVKESYTQQEVSFAYNNALYAEIVSESDIGELKFGLIVGTPKNYQLSNQKVRKIRTPSEFINNANVHVTSYSKTMRTDFDSFSNDALMSRAQKIQAISEGNRTTELAMLSSTKNDLIVRKEVVDRVMSDLAKANMLSLVDSVTFVYDRGRLNITNITYPFDKILTSYIERVMLIYKNEIMSVIKPAIELLGDMKCIIKMCDGFSVAFVKLYEENKMNEFKTIDYLDEILDNYLFENCKSKRYRHTHPSGYDSQKDRIHCLMDWFYDEPF